MKRFLVLLGFLGAFLQAWAQCCMPGAPAGGTANQGVLVQHSLRMVGFYQFSNGNHFYSGSKKQHYSYIEGAHYHFSGIQVAYGITPRLTAEIETGYFCNRTIRYSALGAQENPVAAARGMADVTLQAKYAAYKHHHTQWEITPMLGIRIPTALHPQVVNAQELPIDLQSSTLSFGLTGGFFVYKGLPNKKTRLFWNSRAVYSFPNAQNYQFGLLYNNALFVSQALNHRFTFIGQLRHEWRQPDSKNDTWRSSTGSNLALFAPQINYTTTKQWNFSLQAEIPLYQRYQGIQMGRTVAVALVVNKLLYL
ncbi:MAG TPA: hypothetical protein PK239_05830 [Chitinophagales bacterium]|nr:hypothetical protein [Chitinophagales bacterium]HRK26797.1 hypothetical protein [Chitinophagales bacterium]